MLPSAVYTISGSSRFVFHLYNHYEKTRSVSYRFRRDSSGGYLGTSLSTLPYAASLSIRLANASPQWLNVNMNT